MSGARVSEELDLPEGARRLALIIEYDGGAYVGWERQRNGLGVQEVLEEALAVLAREPVTLEGSGRTDAGVHARGQVASCTFPRPDLPTEKIRLALNGLTPPDVAVLHVVEVPASFHARFGAVAKRYRYTILNDRVRRPLTRHIAHQEPRDLDIDRMAAAAGHFVGTHDFRAFAKEPERKASTVRTVLASELRVAPPYLHYEVEGEGFLYNMVRILSGTLVDIGTGRLDPARLPDLLTGGPRTATGTTLPALGLCLLWVRYPEEMGLPIGVPGCPPTA